jgi:hypothetical protein
VKTMKTPIAFQRIAAAVAKRASARATSSAMKSAREGSWERLELMVQKTGAEPAFESWAEAYSAMIVWAKKAPLRLSATLADTRVCVQPPGGAMESGWWPRASRKPLDACQDAMAMRLGLLIRGVAWETRSVGERRGASTEALLTRFEPDFGANAPSAENTENQEKGANGSRGSVAPGPAAPDWTVQALAALFTPTAKSTDAEAAQSAARIACSAMSGNVSMLWLVGEETGPVGQDLTEEALFGFAVRVEGILAEILGEFLVRGRRGAAVGGLFEAASACRPTMGMGEEKLRSLRRAGDEKWARVLGGLPEGEREACLRQALLTDVMDGDPMRPDRPIVSEQKAKAAWAAAERAWGENGVARAWPEEIQAGAFGELARARKAALAIEAAASAAKKASTDSRDNPTPMAASEARRGVRAGRRL